MNSNIVYGGRPGPGNYPNMPGGRRPPMGRPPGDSRHRWGFGLPFLLGAVTGAALSPNYVYPAYPYQPYPYPYLYPYPYPYSYQS